MVFRHAGDVVQALTCYVMAQYAIFALTPGYILMGDGWPYIGSMWFMTFCVATAAGMTWFVSEHWSVRVFAVTALGCAEGGLLDASWRSDASPAIVGFHTVLAGIQMVRILALNPRLRG